MSAWYGSTSNFGLSNGCMENVCIGMGVWYETYSSFRFKNKYVGRLERQERQDESWSFWETELQGTGKEKQVEDNLWRSWMRLENFWYRSAHRLWLWSAHTEDSDSEVHTDSDFDRVEDIYDMRHGCSPTKGVIDLELESELWSVVLFYRTIAVSKQLSFAKVEPHFHLWE